MSELAEVLVIDEHLSIGRKEQYLYHHFGQEEYHHKFTDNARFMNSFEEYEKAIAEYREQDKWPKIIIFDDCAGGGPRARELINSYIKDLRREGFIGVIIMKYMFYPEVGWEKPDVDHIIELRRSRPEEIRQFLYSLGY